MPGEAFYKTAQWKRVQALVLDRDGHRCRIGGPKCTIVATEADHIIPPADGGPKFDLDNLRAACKACNVRRANLAKHREGWRRSAARIVLIVGPVGGGKSTYAREHAGERDVIVDYDTISQAFGPALTYGAEQRHDVASAARNAVLARLRRGEIAASTVWLVSANPGAEGMFPHHEVVVVDPGRDEVLRRCGRERPASFVRLVDDWYARRATVAAGPSREW